VTILGVDLSSNNPVFDWALARQQGVRAAYIKLGGDNLIPRYVSGSYAGRVDQARAHGMIVGHYWVTGRHDPEAAAAFFVRNLRNVQAGDFFVLDNEHLDDGNTYTDDEAARWIRTVQGLVGGDPRRVFHYASGSPLRQKGAWPRTIATGAQALVAWYDQQPFGFPRPLGDWPERQIGGHQYSSSVNLGNGGRIDANVFKDNAFAFTGTATSGEAVTKIIKELENDMKLIVSVAGAGPKGAPQLSPILAGPFGSVSIVDQTELDGLTVAFGKAEMNDVQLVAVRTACARYAENARLNLRRDTPIPLH